MFELGGEGVVCFDTGVMRMVLEGAVIPKFLELCVTLTGVIVSGIVLFEHHRVL